jgi:hypothetical protein
MKLLRKSLLFTASIALVGIVGCNDSKAENSAESAGDSIERAADKTKDAAESGVEKTGDAVEKAGDKVQDATH